MKPLAGIADARGQHFFHKHVDILRLGIDLQRTGFKVREDFFQSCNDFFGFFFCDDAAFTQHRRMCDTARDVLSVHPAVKGNG